MSLIRAVALYKKHSIINNDPLVNVLLLRCEGDQITGLSDNDPVALWPNIGTSGATNNFVQAVALSQPTWKASDALFNGHPSVVFNALGDGMTCGLNLPNPYTIIFVAAATQVLTGRTINSENNNCLASINRSADAVYNGGDIVSSTASNGTTAHVMSVAIGAQSRCYIDGVDVTTGTGPHVGDWGLLALAYTLSNPEPAAANIAAIGVILGVNDTTRQLIESTWKAKYGTP